MEDSFYYLAHFLALFLGPLVLSPYHLALYYLAHSWIP